MHRAGLKYARVFNIFEGLRVPCIQRRWLGLLCVLVLPLTLLLPLGCLTLHGGSNPWNAPAAAHHGNTTAREWDSRVTNISYEWSQGLQCNLSHPQWTTCLINNAYYWNKTVYIMVPGDPTKFTIPRVEFTIAAAYPMPASLVKTVTQEQLQTVFAGINGMASVQQGILFHRLYPYNTYHHMWNVLANMHIIACSLLGKCVYDPQERDLVALYFDKNNAANTTQHHAALKCITHLPPEEFHHPSLGVPILVRQLTYGLGRQAFGQKQVVGHRDPPSLELRLSWQHRMRTCLGLPAAAPSVAELRGPPILTIIQRDGPGRAIANLEQVQTWLAEWLPSWTVRVSRMSGLRIGEQARVWSESHIVVTTHGAQMSHMLFMPNNSVVLELEQFMFHDPQFYNNTVLQELQPLHLQHYLVPPKGLESVRVVRQKELLAHPSFANLTSQQQQTWLKQPLCNYTWVSPHACYIDWMKRHMDVVVDPVALRQALANATEWLSANAQLRSNAAAATGFTSRTAM